MVAEETEIFLWGLNGVVAIWNGLDEEMTLKAVALGKIKSVFLQIRIEWLCSLYTRWWLDDAK